MASFSVTEQAAADIDDILERTLEHGETESTGSTRTSSNKPWLSSRKTRRAVARLLPRLNPGILGHHIKQPGRNARHIVFYTYDPTNDRVTVLRVLHDSMDFKRHLPA